MKTLSKELTDKIISEIEALTPEFYWDYRDKLDSEQVSKILSNYPDSLYEFESELWDMNIDYIVDIEHDHVKGILDDHEDEILGEMGDDFDINELIDEFRDYLPGIDMKIESLFPSEILCLIVVYSNYDCTNSFDTMESSDYLAQVYKRVKKGVKKEDFLWEHINGAYGGSLFCFAFTTDFKTLLKLKGDIKEGKKVFVPKGTQFGFFSSFQGAGSVFEKTTFQDMEINISETGKDFHPQYDNVDIIADCEQSYSIRDVYGTDHSFASYADIKIK